MASDETINRVSATLKGCFPVWARELSVEARTAWVSFLRGYPDQTVKRAATRVIERHHGPHLTIADFREHIREVQMDSQYDAPQLPPAKQDEFISLEEFIERHPEYAGKAAIYQRQLDAEGGSQDGLEGDAGPARPFSE